MDTFSKQKRSWVMSRITGKNTEPEIALRRFLHARGVRFRVHRKDLPGCPDIVLPKYHTAVLVHGCWGVRPVTIPLLFNSDTFRRLTVHNSGLSDV